MRRGPRVFVLSIGCLWLAAGGALAAADQPRAQKVDPAQTTLVEDFAYPGAGEILARRGITLVKGDGHLLLVACGQPGLIEVMSTDVPHDTDPDALHYCFKASVPFGDLTLTIPNAYQVKGDDHSVTATVTVQNQTSTVPIDKNTWTGIGISSGPDPATLLRLTAKP
ncbi:hypothetical protein [Actinocrispum wychmicini]|uniref:Secreted protein n=1 Tax=Actinocrispum wychmicini TaxID=1213861 RepID=A0A4R2JY18_9PSEU|nr:hypothetical protein [Actinocrispum wychmicini]TCO62266.1 hypothetical protein EV192_102403 [Actinocrispum wychmicini]